jgi:hypothetical protein
MRLLRGRLRCDDDEGVSLVEVGVAAFIMSIIVSSLMAAMGAGMGLVGHSRQRSAGAGVAQERVERARNVAYEDLALNEDPTHNADAGHPDNKVVENNPSIATDDRYTVEPSACASPPCTEPLLIDTVDGGLKHLDDPFTLANTDFTVHQYVTGVDDPSVNGSGSYDYKRVTVVVTWKFPVHTGPKHTVVESTFVSDGEITIPSTAAPSLPPATPAPTPPIGGDDDLGVGTLLGFLLGPLQPPSGGQGVCAGDVTRPELESAELLSGSGTDQGYLNSTAVQVRIKGRDPECFPLTLYMANKTTKNDCTNSSGYTEVQQLDGGGEPPAITATWTIPAGDGFKAVCAVIRNKSADTSSNTSQVWGVNVKLDTTKPTVPGDFRETACNVNGNDRVATLAWNTATDENFYGYRLYRSVESAPFVLINKTTALSITDSSLKNYASVRYFVRGYDKAGNESVDSVVLSYSKNQC